jgi:hypothetical protein
MRIGTFVIGLLAAAAAATWPVVPGYASPLLSGVATAPQLTLIRLRLDPEKVAMRRGGVVARGPRGGVVAAGRTTVARPVPVVGRPVQPIARPVRPVGRPIVVAPGWRRPAAYWWRPGTALAAGAAVGFVTATAAAAYAGAPPAPNYCWYYTDPSRTKGFWDVCPVR